MSTAYLEVHPAHYVTFGEALAFIGISESDITWILAIAESFEKALVMESFYELYLLGTGYVEDYKHTGIVSKDCEICAIAEDLYMITYFGK